MLDDYEVRCRDGEWVVVDTDSDKIVASYPKSDPRSQANAAAFAYKLNNS